MTISEQLIEDMNHSWRMLRDAIERIPEEHWRRGEVDYLIPARHVLHAIEAVDFYISPSPNEFKWGDRFDVDWEGAPADVLPSQAALGEYLDEVSQRFAEWLGGFDDGQVMAADEAWGRFASRMARANYVIRHNHQHIGEINAELRRRGIDRLKW